MPYCHRCGRKAQTEYGNDGLGYCQSCIFFGRNKICPRCGAYVPTHQFQPVRGTKACISCAQSMRADDKRTELAKNRKEPVRIVSYSERCDRCGRDLKTVFIWNNKKLCKKCVSDGQKGWEIVAKGPADTRQNINEQKAKKGTKTSEVNKRNPGRRVSDTVKGRPRVNPAFSKIKPHLEKKAGRV